MIEEKFVIEKQLQPTSILSWWLCTAVRSAIAMGSILEEHHQALTGILGIRGPSQLK